MSFLSDVVSLVRIFSNAEQRRLSEEIDALHRAEESLQENHTSFPDESIHQAIQKQIHENLIRYLALMEYPKGQLRVPVALAIFTFVACIYFTALTGFSLMTVEDFAFSKMYWLGCIASFLANGITCSSLVTIGERQSHLESYVERLRNGIHLCNPRQPNDDAQFNKKINRKRYLTYWGVHSVVYAFLGCCIYLPIVIFSSTGSEQSHWKGLIIFWLIWFIGSGILTASVEWLSKKDFNPQEAASPKRASNQEHTDLEDIKNDGQCSGE